jgi:hypothetical protein
MLLNNTQKDLFLHYKQHNPSHVRKRIINVKREI